MKRGATFVYFVKPVGMDGPIKIGCSNAPENRLEQLAVWSPWPLEVIGAVPGNLRDEGYLHSCFAEQHSHREWFHASPRLRAAIERIVKAGTVDVVRSELTPVRSIRPSHNRKRSPEHCLYLSYSSRTRHTEQRLRKSAGEDGAWRAPDDVRDILSDWVCHRNSSSIIPSPEKLARLDQYLADPAAASVVPRWHLEKAAA